MEKDEVVKNMQLALDKHKSLFVIGRSLLDELSENRFFDDYEKEKIGTLLEAILGNISENRAMIADTLQYTMDGDQNKVF